MCCKKDICIVLLVGIPCSGKTFFQTFLQTYFKKHYESVLKSVLLCSVSYDDYNEVRNPNLFCDNHKWKDERRQILRTVESILIHLKVDGCKNLSSCFPHIFIVNEHNDNSDCCLIVIDDNMYYRSMRYEYYKLAKNNEISFCQVFFDVTLQDSLKFNRKRGAEAKVPEKVIETMFQKIEPPQFNHSWENRTVKVTSFINLNDTFILGNILTSIKDALENPIKSTKNLTDLLKKQSQAVTNSNVIHQIDICLKQIVGFLIKENIKVCSTQHGLAKYFSDKRLRLLKDIKYGEIVLPVDLDKPINKEDINMLRPVLLDLLKK